MGQRLAPILAICFMSRIEQPILARMPLMHCRYIDDCCIVTSTQSEMNECFKILNLQSQYIRLTRECLHDGFLYIPYLNTQVKLSKGIVAIKWYRKETSKNNLIHASSAHPAATKRAVIRNMFKTAVEVCISEAERCESRKIAAQIAISNGYSISQRRLKSPVENSNQFQREHKLAFFLPFTSDKFDVANRQCLAWAQLQNDVLLVSIPNDNIKKQLVRNRLYDRECRTEHCVICPYGKVSDCLKVKGCVQGQAWCR
ncbi:hypothetical protein Y032_0442g1542 [Ancylostoma ceylanicum]|uniref:Helix-turn-helix domain-containing protein n=1 Tax=Ancylostoma ceylanicum TaxID=53326 RepID=A0A016X198_9BILA|nr:hypothetical protein Y032_0442g1542 [Ancylostoma ceylanicum]